jgi:hypothetical protein
MVQGKLTAADALVRLVQGTGLEAHSDTNGLSVSQADQNRTGLKAAALQAQFGQAIKSQPLAPSTANALYSASLQSSAYKQPKRRDTTE